MTYCLNVWLNDLLFECMIIHMVYVCVNLNGVCACMCFARGVVGFSLAEFSLRDSNNKIQASTFPTLVWNWPFSNLLFRGVARPSHTFVHVYLCITSVKDLVNTDSIHSDCLLFCAAGPSPIQYDGLGGSQNGSVALFQCL